MKHAKLIFLKIYSEVFEKCKKDDDLDEIRGEKELNNPRPCIKSLSLLYANLIVH